MEIILIRHGQSEGDILEVHEGRADLELTDEGTRQARKMALWLKDYEQVDKIVSSPLKRALKTATMIKELCGCTLEIDDALMEWDNGLLAGVKRDEAMRKFPLPEGGRKPHDTLYETESMIDFRTRAELFISKLKETHYERICLVSHGGMINMLLRSLLELPMTSQMSFSCGDTCLHKIKLLEKECHIYYLNKIV